MHTASRLREALCFWSGHRAIFEKKFWAEAFVGGFLLPKGGEASLKVREKGFRATTRYGLIEKGRSAVSSLEG